VGTGFVIGTRVASGAEEINGTVAGLGVPLLVLGGTFFPADMLPPALHAAAQFNPVFHMNQAFKTVALEPAGIAETWPNELLLAVFTVVAMWMGARAWDRMLRVEQRAEEVGT
jgi:ABC-2 type transport system permease protein